MVYAYRLDNLDNHTPINRGVVVVVNLAMLWSVVNSCQVVANRFPVVAAHLDNLWQLLGNQKILTTNLTTRVYFLVVSCQDFRPILAGVEGAI